MVTRRTGNINSIARLIAREAKATGKLKSMGMKLSRGQRRTLRAFRRASRTGAPYTREGSLHHRAMHSLCNLGLVYSRQVGRRTFWCLTPQGVREVERA